jgi:hypothetical protein
LSRFPRRVSYTARRGFLPRPSRVGKRTPHGLRGLYRPAQQGRTCARAAQLHTDVSPTVVIPNVPKRFLGMLDRLDTVRMRDSEWGREELRGILGERIKLLPDESGRFLWAQYTLGLQALLPNAEIMVAGACFRLIARL